MSAENLCAMGKPGYSLENGELYAPRHPCTRQRDPGHIFCKECRAEAGGYVRHRVPLLGGRRPQSFNFNLGASS